MSSYAEYGLEVKLSMPVYLEKISPMPKELKLFRYRGILFIGTDSSDKPWS